LRKAIRPKRHSAPRVGFDCCCLSYIYNQATCTNRSTHPRFLGKFHLGQDYQWAEIQARTCNTGLQTVGGDLHGDTRNISLIQSGYPGQHSGHQKTLGDSQHLPVMVRLPLPVLVLLFVLGLLTTLRFYADSVNDQALIDWRRTLLWGAFFLVTQGTGFLILVRLWG
jgi:hypothetical protein